MEQNIVSVSGGVDSAACYLLALESGKPFQAVFMDTGNEHSITYDYIQELPIKTGGPPVRIIKADFTTAMAVRRYGLEHMLDTGIYLRGWTEITIQRVLKNLACTGIPMLDLCMLKGRFPSANVRFCTTVLKMEVVNKQIIGPAIHEAISSGGQACDAISWVGIRRNESRERANAEEWETGRMGHCIFRPLVEWKKDECFSLLKRHGLRANPLYYMGFSRVGCMPCIHSQKSEILNISKRFPEHIDKVREWERLVTLCNKGRIKSTFFASDKTPSRDYAYSDIDTVVSWAKTGRGGNQFDMLANLPIEACSSQYGLCE